MIVALEHREIGDDHVDDVLAGIEMARIAAKCESAKGRGAMVPRSPPILSMLKHVWKSGN